MLSLSSLHLDSSFYASFLSPLLILLTAPLITGVLNKLRSRIESRQGPSVFQPYYDLHKLLNKELILPEASSWIFRLFPYFVLIVTVLVSFLLPVFFDDSLFAYFSDLIFIFALFVLVAFFMVLASFDAGTSFVGMGSAREAFLVSLIEPVAMLIVFALSMEFGSSNLFNIVRQNISGFELFSHPSSFFVAIAFLTLILAEAKRLPVDNPSTHLELTMIHEALLLEYSGKYLAMLEYASMLKLSILLSLFFSLFFSWGMAQNAGFNVLVVALITWGLKMLVSTFFIALYEKSTAKLRLFKVPELLSFALVISLIAIFAHYYIQLW